MKIKDLFGFFNAKNDDKQVESQLTTKDYMKNSVVNLDQIFENYAYYGAGKDTIVQPAKNNYLVYKCIQTLSDRISMVPIKFYNKGSMDMIDPEQSLGSQFIMNPGPYLFHEFLARTIMFYALYGESFWVWVDSIGSELGTTTKPNRIDIVDPLSMTEDLTEYYQLKGWMYVGMYNNNVIKNYLPRENVIQIKNQNPYNMWRGLRATDALALELGVDQKTLKEMIRFYDNFAQPSSYLTAPMDSAVTPEMMEGFVKKLKRKISGDNKYSVAGFNNGIELKTIGVSPKDQLVTDTKNFIRDAVLAVFNVPLTYAGFTEGINRATADAQERNFWQYAQAILYKIQSTINYMVLPRIDPTIECTFDYDTISALKPDMTESVTAAKGLLEMGWTPDDLNEKFNWDLPEIEGITNRSYKPFNLETIAVNGQEIDEPDTEPVDNTVKEIQTDALNKNIVRKKFLKVQDLQERKLKKNFRNYVVLQRSKVLKKLNTVSNKFDTFDHFQKDEISKVVIYELIQNLSDIFDNENKRLKSRFEPIYTETTEKGQRYALDLLNIDRDVILYKQIVKDRINYISGINDSTFKRIKKQIFEGVNNGETIDQIGDRIKTVYDFAENRAQVIARTETANIINAATNLEYRSNGVARKQWITTGDDRVRDSCRLAEAQGPINIDDTFANGHEYPTEINCRCCISPVVE